jgi:hypothetical protein
LNRSIDAHAPAMQLDSILIQHTKSVELTGFYHCTWPQQ